MTTYSSALALSKQARVEGFFTGKPYDSDLKAYTFLFRNYRPELGKPPVNPYLHIPGQSGHRIRFESGHRIQSNAATESGVNSATESNLKTATFPAESEWEFEKPKT